MLNNRVVRDDGMMKAIIEKVPVQDVLQERANESARRFEETLKRLVQRNANGREVS